MKYFPTEYVSYRVFDDVGRREISYLESLDYFFKPSMSSIFDLLEDKDRGEKFQHYQRIPGFREYVLVSQKEISVEVFFRLDEKTWEYRRYSEADEAVPLQSLEISLRLQDLYARVEFEEKA